MIPVPLCGFAVADRHIEVPLSVYDGSRRRPYASLTRGRNLVCEQRSRAIGARGHYPAMVVATVAVQPTEGNIDYPSREGQSRPLLMRLWVHSGRIHQAADFDVSRFDVNADNNMAWPLYLCHSVDQTRLRIVDRRAGDAEGINIATRQI